MSLASGQLIEHIATDMTFERLVMDVFSGSFSKELTPTQPAPMASKFAVLMAKLKRQEKQIRSFHAVAVSVDQTEVPAFTMPVLCWAELARVAAGAKKQHWV